MPRSQRNDNFIDKTFTILADILIRILPTTKRRGKLLYTTGMVRFEKGGVFRMPNKSFGCVSTIDAAPQATAPVSRGSRYRASRRLNLLIGDTWKS
ncbi:hypothetical protein GOP47_0000232 [Adiantum capillus-veneris]|uniref:Uncharacterized protein n=1 Tax=Adiantum capillus-veneris TaxID=13818 RepID=A0A9D4VEK1_ADICA|nr:hypothetical protein GOP47_0000232 [Adiantum capillus-veneris]